MKLTLRNKIIESMWQNYPCIVVWLKYNESIMCIPLVLYDRKSHYRYIELSLFSDLLVYTGNMTYEDFHYYWCSIWPEYLSYIKYMIKPVRDKVRIAK